jgi:hypothetical protein
MLLAVVCIAASAAYFAFRLIRGTGDPTRRHCPACDYDLSATQGRMCPECGNTARSESATFGRRRRPVAAALSLVLAITSISVGLYWNARWRIYYDLINPWTLQTTTVLAGYTVRHYSRTDPDNYRERIVISRAGQSSIALEDVTLTLGSTSASNPVRIGVGEDITGDGVPDLAIGGYSGGHCCFTLHVIELGSRLRTLATIDLDRGGELVMTDTPSVAEVIFADPTFIQWNANYANSAKPLVVLRWREGAFRLHETGAQRVPRLDEPTLATRSADLRTREPLYNGFVNPEVWSTALDLIYAGYYNRGLAFIREAWNPDSGDLEKFLAEFTKTLESSPYWPEIKAIKPRP